MEKKITAKDTIELEHDFYSLTVLSYLKENKDKMLLS